VVAVHPDGAGNPKKRNRPAPMMENDSVAATIYLSSFNPCRIQTLSALPKGSIVRF
jgi:hypothetical protein